tara:strand:+ start:988 stop:1356 length:369 start_codon:yes stop_codon:yes gene_type:complete
MLSYTNKWTIRLVFDEIKGIPNQTGTLGPSVQSPRIAIGWLAFMLLIAFSIYSFIDTGSITLEAWISLLLTPAALALALNRNTWWNRDSSHEKTLVEEEYIELNSNKDVPNPEEDGFDVPVL